MRPQKMKVIPPRKFRSLLARRELEEGEVKQDGPVVESAWDRAWKQIN